LKLFENGLIRRRKKKHVVKRDLREVKKRLKLFELIQIDTKELSHRDLYEKRYTEVLSLSHRDLYETIFHHFLDICIQQEM